SRPGRSPRSRSSPAEFYGAVVDAGFPVGGGPRSGRPHEVACPTAMQQGFTARRILVPINGNPTDDEAVRLACRLARRQRAKVYVVTILEVKRSLALGTVQDVEVEEAERLLDRAETIGAELDVEVDTELLQAREAGPASVDE